MNVRLAPSILSADFAALGEAVAMLERGGADLVHLDVMDGHFVPNLTIGPAAVKAVRRVTKLPLEAHLMVTEPDRFIEVFAAAGAQTLTVHAEVLPHLHRTIQAIKRLGCRAGVALNPLTPPTVLSEVIGEVDLVLVMSVNPGFGGQAFIPNTESKIQRVRQLLEASGSNADVEVDGGIDQGNIARVVSAGASVIVVGAAIFEQPDPVAATRALRARAVAAAGPGAR